MESQMKNALLATVIFAGLASLTPFASARESIIHRHHHGHHWGAYDGGYIFIGPRDPASVPPGCDESAGGAAKLDACEPDGQAAGGSNSGR
jgi:hypothetical protein